MDWTFPASGPLKVDLELPTGSVELELSATDEVRVQLEPFGRDNDSAREQIAGASVTCHDWRLDVRVPKRKLRDAPLHLRVLAPPASSARIRTATADIACAGLLGALQAKTASGDVIVQDGCDAANVSTASGDIRLAGVLGEAELQTASGDVTTQSIGGRASVTTASGDIRIASAAHDARLRSASGDVVLGCAYEGDLSVNTASGDVRIGVGSGVGAWLDLITVSGESTCTLAAEAQGEGGAELRISCRTVSGDILIHSGEPEAGGQSGGDAGSGASEGVAAGSGAPEGGGAGGGAAGGDSSGLGADDRYPGALDRPDLPSASISSTVAVSADAGEPSNCPDAAGAGSLREGVAQDFGGLSDLSSVLGMPGLARLADLADFAGFGDVAERAMGRITTERGMRLPWHKP